MSNQHKCRVCMDRGRVRVLPAGEPTHGHAMWMDCPLCKTSVEFIRLRHDLKQARAAVIVFTLMTLFLTAVIIATEVYL